MAYARVVFLVLIGLMTASAVQAQVCTKGEHAIRLKGKNVPLRDYNCEFEANGSGLRVTFFRVSELVAGALLKNEPVPDLERIVGPVNLVDSDVSREVSALFANFGSKLTYESADRMEFELEAGKAEEKYQRSDPSPPLAKQDQATPVTAWYLTRVFNDITSDGVLLRSPSEAILNTDRWPTGYQMNYSCTEQEIAARGLVTCTTLWKYITIRDFDAILSDMRAAKTRAERSLQSDDFKTTVREGVSALEKNFLLFRFLDTRTLPDDFLFITNQASAGNACEPTNWHFMLSARPLLLDLAVIENLTAKPIRIDEFMGSARQGSNFRAVDDATKPNGTTGSLGLAPTTIDPGKRIALALRIVFSHDTSFDAQIYQVTPDETFRRILAKPAKTDFGGTIGGFTAGKTVRKVRESFLRPQTPKAQDYAYGPEIELSGLSVDGKKLQLETPELNIVNGGSSKSLDVGINQISAIPLRRGECCPRLYSWREDMQTWAYSGKILHLANGQDRKTTERVEFPSLRTRFRIAEEEAEVFFLERMQLDLKLRDGRSVQAMARRPVNSTIPAYASFDIEYDLPNGVTADDVLTSQLEITGYYRRLSDLSFAADRLDDGSR